MAAYLVGEARAANRLIAIRMLRPLDTPGGRVLGQMAAISRA
jgi:hypothetical protein